MVNFNRGRWSVCSGIGGQFTPVFPINEALNVVFEENHEIEIDALRLNNTHYSFHLSDLGFNARMINEFEKLGSEE